MLIFGTESGSIFEGSLNNPVVVHGPEKTGYADPIHKTGKYFGQTVKIGHYALFQNEVQMEF